MKRSSVIKKKIKLPSGMQDKNIGDMFNQMLGAGSLNIKVAYPRYKRIREILNNLIATLELANETSFMKNYIGVVDERQELDNFIKQSRDAIKELFATDFKDNEWDLGTLAEEQIKSFEELYNGAKNSQLVRGFIIMCDRLVPYKRYLRTDKPSKDFLSPVFITSMPGVEFKPFPFSQLNLKAIFALPDIGKKTIEFFMSLLSKCYELSYQLYNEISSPDVAVDDFVEIINANIGDIKKIPELNRCRGAFAKIEESIYMLKDNFNGYYRDFIQSKNSTIIMENFILDVSKSSGKDPKLIHEFQQIISYYRKVAQTQITNPQVKNLFEKVDASFKSLEKDTTNLSKGTRENESEDESSESESSDEESKETVEPAETELDKARRENAEKSIDELCSDISNTKFRKRNPKKNVDN